MKTRPQWTVISSKIIASFTQHKMVHKEELQLKMHSALKRVNIKRAEIILMLLHNDAHQVDSP
jgi:hypothetical protein